MESRGARPAPRRFARCWEGHEFRRYNWPSWGGLRSFPQQRWNGERFDGKRLLLWPEQGIGDQLQFARFIPRVKALGGTVVLGCSSGLVSLFKANCPDADEVVVIGESFSQVDLQLPLMSVPHVLRLRDRLDASVVPYFQAHGKAATELHRALPDVTLAQGRALRVGIAWAGQPKHLNDRNRSLMLETLRPLLTCGLEWFSLRRDAAKSSLRVQCAFQRNVNACHHAAWSAVADFNDTAHAVSRLDVVISVVRPSRIWGRDGRAGMAAYSFVPDWRWQVTRDDSPWYPSARLFRQPNPGDWSTVVAQVANVLAEVGRVSTHSLSTTRAA